MKLTLLVATALPCVHAGISAVVSSNDLMSGPKFDNVKATWDSDLSIAGSKAKLSLLYDLKAKKDFAKEMKLAGAVSDVKYVITHAIGKGTTAVTLATKQAGHVLKAIGDTSDMLTKLSATGSADVAGVDIAYEPSYLIKKQVLATKVTLNAALGAGVSAMAAVTATSSGDVSANYELGYGASLGEGRALSVSVDPVAKEAEVELVDTITEAGATWVAQLNAAPSSTPKLTLRRAMKF